MSLLYLGRVCPETSVYLVALTTTVIISAPGSSKLPRKLKVLKLGVLELGLLKKPCVNKRLLDPKQLTKVTSLRFRPVPYHTTQGLYDDSRTYN